jgi:hypothetical protein
MVSSSALGQATPADRPSFTPLSESASSSPTLQSRRSFLGRRAGSAADGRWVLREAIVTLGRTLELDLVAEGIETPGEQHSLEALGVHLGQGFHLGRPGPAALVCPTPGMRPVERRSPTSIGASLRPPADAASLMTMTALPPVPARPRHAADG